MDKRQGKECQDSASFPLVSLPEILERLDIVVQLCSAEYLTGMYGAMGGARTCLPLSCCANRQKLGPEKERVPV